MQIRELVGSAAPGLRLLSSYQRGWLSKDLVGRAGSRTARGGHQLDRPWEAVRGPDRGRVPLVPAV